MSKIGRFKACLLLLRLAGGLGRLQFLLQLLQLPQRITRSLQQRFLGGTMAEQAAQMLRFGCIWSILSTGP